MARGKSVGLHIPISADAKGASKAFKQVQQDVSSIDQTLSSTKQQIGTLFAAYAGTQFLRSATEATASLAEAQNTASVIFGESAEAVLAFGEGSAKAIGQSERMALQAANGYGALLVNMGYTREQAAGLSQSLTGLASDLSAAWDKPIEQALGALQSGLSGEMEPLKQFGVVLNDAELKQRAFNLGVYDGTGILNANQKAQAVLSLVMEKSSDAQGAYGRESDGLLQRQQRLNAEWENAKANLGEGLIPVMQAGVTAALAMTDAWGKIPGELQAATLAGVGLVVVLPKIVAGYKAANTAVMMFRLGLDGVIDKKAGAANAAGGLIHKVGGIKPVMAGAGVAAAGLGLVLYGLQENANNAAERAADLAANIATIRAEADATGSSIEDAFRKTVMLDFATKGADGMAKLGISVTDLQDAVTGTDEEWAAFIKRVTAGSSGIDRLAIEVPLHELRKSLVGATKEEKAFTAAQKEAGLASESAAGSVNSQTSAVGRLSEALERANKRIQDRISILDAQWDERDAVEATRQAVADLADARAAATGASEEYADAQQAIADAHRAEADAAQNVVDAQGRVREAQQDLNEAYAEAVRNLIDKAQAAREAADAEAGALLAVERAEKELQRARAKGSDALTIREAQQKVREAQTAAAAATIDAKNATEDNARAAAAGVEGDEGVVAAKKAVADANRAVVDAERQVQDARKRTAEAEKRAADVIAAGRKRVEDASKNLKSAMEREAEAAGKLAEQQHGAAAGAKAHADRLRELAGMLAPGSQYRQDMESYAASLLALHQLEMDTLFGTQGHAVASGQSSLAAAEAQIRERERAALGASGGRTVSQTFILQGTPEQQRRAMADAAAGHGDALARGAG